MLPLWDSEKHRRAPAITVALIAVNLVVFGYEAFLALTDGRAFAGFIGRYALTPAWLLDAPGDPRAWLTVLTSMFLHGGFGHVLGNCWFLWIFGNNVEDRLGPVKFLLLYLFAGAAAAAAQIASHPGSEIPMLGASGAISGVLGAYVVILPMAWIYTLVPWVVPIVPVPAFVFLFVWFGLQMVNGVGALMSGGSSNGGVAWWAHAGGFVAGLVLMRRLAGRRRR